MVQQLRHLASTVKLFGALTAALVVVLGSLALVSGSHDDTTAYAEANATRETFGLDVAVAQSTDVFVEKTTAALDFLALKTAKAANAGWRTVDGVRYYYQVDGTIATGTLHIDGVEMSFDDEGRWVSSRLDVPYISQLPDMPSGCEVVSVTMMLNFAGVPVSKEEVAARLPYADDPNMGFTGDLYASGDSGYGGIIWPPALLDLVSGYYGSAVDLTGQPLDEIQAYIEQGKPVCIWFRDYSLDHCVVLTGLSATTAWVNDPLEDKDVALDLADFLFRWEMNAYRALSY
ncbi:MAG: C39 family peptidase [Coriobacteriales bacterium]|jgi:uncharacterized protein YvpB|nr:C39 family peptidase [Coriobacteriales bacterium]